MLQSFAAEKCAYLVFSTSYLLPVECTQISCHPAADKLHVRAGRDEQGRGKRGAGGKGQLGWSAAKVYPFFFSALISIIDDATVHSIGKGKTTSTAAAVATLAAAAAHAIK